MGGRGPCLGAQGAPRGSAESKGGRLPPPNRVGLGLVGGSPSLPSHLPFFSFSLIFLCMAHRALLGCPTSPLRAGAPPPRPMGFPGVGCPPGEHPEPIRHSRYIPGNSENLPVIKWGHPIYQSSFPDHSGNPRDVRDLIRDSEQHSVTNHITQIRIKQRRTLSVQTLRVRELCRHDPRDSSVNIQ